MSPNFLKIITDSTEIMANEKNFADTNNQWTLFNHYNTFDMHYIWYNHYIAFDKSIITCTTASMKPIYTQYVWNQYNLTISLCYKCMKPIQPYYFSMSVYNVGDSSKNICENRTKTMTKCFY